MALPAATDFTGPDITEAQFKTAMIALVEYLEDLETITPGLIAYFPRTTAPSGWLKVNGAVITVAAYSALVAATYCGDAANATAPSYYRCTNPENPSGTRSTSGAYFKLADLRGEFIRGLDNGRGVDTGRVLGSTQGQSIQTHTHTIPVYDAGNVISPLARASADSNSSSALVGNPATAGTGAVETRPRNVALLACIKY